MQTKAHLVNRGEYLESSHSSLQPSAEIASESKHRQVPTRHYASIDGLRVISCISIIAMHIQANTEYAITEAGVSGFLYHHFVPALTWLVYLFLMISGFGMCAGYLKRFQDGTVELESFYKKRYAKILPFFGFLLIIALAFEPSLVNFYEATVEAMFLHGLLPNNAMNVLGVCWTLGVIFLFYLLFPAFTVLMKSKRRAWVALVASLWINFICQQYFFTETFVTELFTPRHSFIYCLPLFIAGGLVYLYRNEIRAVCGRHRWGILLLCILVTVIYFIYKVYGVRPRVEYYILLPVFMLWLSYVVGVDSKILSCKAMRYLGSISMEMYLAQMIIFRLVEKMKLLYVLGTGWLGFLMSTAMTVIGLMIFIECYKRILVPIVRKAIGKLPL